MKLKRIAGLLVVAAVAVSFTACSSKSNSVKLQGAGASFPAPLYLKWFKTYSSANPSVQVDYQSVGSGSGVKSFMDKTVDFAASDAAMKPEDMARVDGGVQLLPMAAGAIVLAYNLQEVPNLGEIKNWNDPRIAKTNPGVTLPNLTIVTVVRQDKSGTTFAFTNNLSAVSDRWRSLFGPATMVNWPGDAMRADGNEGVAGLIEKSVGAIGYVGYEFANRLGLDMAALENKEGKYIQPAEQSCQVGLATTDLPDNLRAFVPDPAGAESYPIVTFSWILLRKTYPDPQIANALRDLVRWSLQDGQRYSSQIGYVPVPSAVADKALTALNGVSPGS